MTDYERKLQAMLYYTVINCVIKDWEQFKRRLFYSDIRQHWVIMRHPKLPNTTVEICIAYRPENHLVSFDLYLDGVEKEHLGYIDVLNMKSMESYSHIPMEEETYDYCGSMAFAIYDKLVNQYGQIN